jgi:ABC-2 type transport system ATP-binding protein
MDRTSTAKSPARSGQTIRFLPSGPFHEGLLTRLPEVTRVEREGQQAVVTGTGELVTAVILALNTAGVRARDVRLVAPDLDDRSSGP